MQKHLDNLRTWQTRAQAVADQATHNGTKKAVENTKMTEAEREAAGELFSEMEDVIFPICHHAFRKAVGSEGPTPKLELEDVMSESYILFLRCLVRYDPDKSDLKTYLLHALRTRVTDYLRSQSEHQARREEDRPPVRNQDRFQGHSNQRGEGPDIDVLGGFDVVAIVNELVEEGRLPGENVEEMWSELPGT